MRARFLLAAGLVGLALSACVTLESRSPPPDVSVEAIEQLRHDLPSLVLSFALVVIGIGSVILARFHWAVKGLELTAFGAFSFLYGVRLAVWTPLARSLVDLPPETWDYLEAVITYFVPLPVLFFLEPFLGKARVIRLLWRLQLGFAIVATVTDIATGTPYAAQVPYNFTIITWFLVALYLMFWRVDNATKQLKIVRAGLAVFVLLAVPATLSGILPLPLKTSAEPLGLFVFFLSLGYVVVDDFFSSQQKLGAINQELETARKIQSSVLPEALPRIDGLDLAVRYVPLSAVAGDFYDYLDNDRGLSLLVADVSGHGIPAALITSMVKIAYSAQSERIEHPSTVLSEVNRILCGKIRGQFVTGACLFFDADGSKVSYASAGHPPLVLVKSSGEASERKLESVLMGFFAQAEYQEMDVELEKGDKLVLYTDGLTEAMNTRGDFFGVERLLAFFEEHASDSAEALAAEILDHVQSWSGKPFDDDVTLLIVGVT
jgi:sigma-B regulation protein RsbU (phosphoserine phosphatase)